MIRVRVTYVTGALWILDGRSFSRNKTELHKNRTKVILHLLRSSSRLFQRLRVWWLKAASPNVFKDVEHRERCRVSRQRYWVQKNRFCKHINNIAHRYYATVLLQTRALAQPLHSVRTAFACVTSVQQHQPIGEQDKVNSDWLCWFPVSKRRWPWQILRRFLVIGSTFPMTESNGENYKLNTNKTRQNKCYRSNWRQDSQSEFIFSCSVVGRFLGTQRKYLWKEYSVIFVCDSIHVFPKSIFLRLLTEHLHLLISLEHTMPYASKFTVMSWWCSK